MIARRRFLQVSAAALAALATRKGAAQVADPVEIPGRDALLAAWARIEHASGGRLGVTLRDSATGAQAGYRADERFPMCSTFKFLLAAAVLARVDAGRLALDRRLPVGAADLLEYAPVSRRHVGAHGLSVAEATEAALCWSDNTAANLLFPLVDGPAGLTAFIRASGDTLTRSDRIEPEMNRFAAGDPRDTTTPAAMAANLQRIVLGDVLQPASRARLRGWLVGNRTGDARLRAGLPAGWAVGDKTGSNGVDTTNDIGLLWPPGGRAPLLLAVYLQGSSVDAKARDALLAEVARSVAAGAA
jgi:beta-lactamase class A